MDAKDRTGPLPDGAESGFRDTNDCSLCATASWVEQVCELAMEVDVSHFSSEGGQWNLIPAPSPLKVNQSKAKGAQKEQNTSRSGCKRSPQGFLSSLNLHSAVLSFLLQLEEMFLESAFSFRRGSVEVPFLLAEQLTFLLKASAADWGKTSPNHCPQGGFI